MAKFRLDVIADLARQLTFTPLSTRFGQTTAAEKLLHDLDPHTAYPLDYIIYRITGYQPKVTAEQDLLTGLALQHDLGLLIELVSDTLKLEAAAMSEPILSIGDVTLRFEVTSKTIQRWRRKGLPARRFVFPDGKRRVGFFLSSVETYIARHGEQQTTLCSAVEDLEQAAIVRNARRLSADCACNIDEICLRVGKKFRRSTLTILHTLRKHDAEHPADQILTAAAGALSGEQRLRVVRLFGRGLSCRKISRRLHQPRSVVYRAILHDRVAQLNRRKVRYIEDPLYGDPDAALRINEIVAQEELPASPLAGEFRTPRDLPAYLADLYRVPLLTPARERALFLKFNFHKCQFVTSRRRLEPQFARVRDLEHLEKHLQQATATKNDILRANLRLVVSVARRHVRPGVTLMELISEGNITLMRAVEGFDVHKGNRFSTYATLALMKGFAQSVPAMLDHRRLRCDVELLTNLPDARQSQTLSRQCDEEHLQQLLSRLDDRERSVLLAHYGLGTAAASSYEQLAEQFGLTKQRVRQIEKVALAKLRA